MKIRRLFEFRSTAFVELILIAGVVLTIACGGSDSANSNAETDPAARGRQIVNEYLKRDSAPFRKSRIRFSVTEEGEPTRVYEIESWRKQTDQETITLNDLVVVPQGEDPARSLTIEANNKKTVVVTYAASRDEFRETDSKKMPIGGLSVGELLGDWDKFNYRLVGEKDLNGTKVFEVEGKLKPEGDSVVSRIDVAFRADNYVPAESHLFASDGKEIRVYKTAAIQDDPAHPYASRVEVDNSVYRSHIVIDVLAREYPATIDDSMFSKEKLKQPVRK